MSLFHNFFFETRISETTPDPDLRATEESLHPERLEKLYPMVRVEVGDMGLVPSIIPWDAFKLTLQINKLRPEIGVKFNF